MPPEEKIAEQREEQHHPAHDPRILRPWSWELTELQASWDDPSYFAGELLDEAVHAELLCMWKLHGSQLTCDIGRPMARERH